jgi:hypothetical protein
MTEPDDPLEAELAALRPHAVSPGLRRRIAERLARSPSFRWRWLGGIGLAGGLAAACLAAAILLRHENGPGLPQGPGRAAIGPPPQGPSDESLPTVQVYQRALSQSPEELDAVLDRHAVRASRSDPPAAQVYASPRSAVEVRALLGEP